MVAATKNFAAATKRFVDRTKHFVVVTKKFWYPYTDFVGIITPFIPCRFPTTQSSVIEIRRKKPKPTYVYRLPITLVTPLSHYNDTFLPRERSKLGYA